MYEYLNASWNKYSFNSFTDRQTNTKYFDVNSTIKFDSWYLQRRSFRNVALISLKIGKMIHSVRIFLLSKNVLLVKNSQKFENGRVRRMFANKIICICYTFFLNLIFTFTNHQLTNQTIINTFLKETNSLFYKNFL